MAGGAKKSPGIIKMKGAVGVVKQAQRNKSGAHDEFRLQEGEEKRGKSLLSLRASYGLQMCLTVEALGHFSPCKTMVVQHTKISMR